MVIKSRGKAEAQKPRSVLLKPSLHTETGVIVEDMCAATPVNKIWKEQDSAADTEEP